MSDKTNWTKLGGLWQKNKDDGTCTFSGDVKCPHCHQTTRVYVAPNGFAEVDRAAGKNVPDWTVKQPPPREGQ